MRLISDNPASSSELFPISSSTVRTLVWKAYTPASSSVPERLCGAACKQLISLTVCVFRRVATVWQSPCLTPNRD